MIQSDIMIFLITCIVRWPSFTTVGVIVDVNFDGTGLIISTLNDFTARNEKKIADDNVQKSIVSICSFKNHASYLCIQSLLSAPFHCVNDKLCISRHNDCWVHHQRGSLQTNTTTIIDLKCMLKDSGTHKYNKQ